jgi:hypothetical protein
MKKLKQLLVFLGMSLIGYHANAQFVLPSIQDSSYGVSPIYSRNTGCDILTFYNNTYRVSVWEHDTINRNMGWVVDYNGKPYTGTLPFTYSNGITDPDVCLLTKSNSTVLAAVAYYEISSSNYYLEIFEWKTSTMAFSSVYITNFSHANFGTTINIDANSNLDGEFAIVWDDTSNNIYAAVGNSSSAILSTNWITNGKNPDVSIYVDNNSDVIHLCYINNVNGKLTVSDYNFSDLSANFVNIISGPYTYDPIILNYKWQYPRIASPGPNGGSVNEWTVVAFEHENSTSTPSPNWYVRGINNGGVSTINYNLDSVDISKVANYYVSVCYSSNYPTDGIYVGWSFFHENQFSGIPIYNNIIDSADYSIVVRCDKFAMPKDSLYWQVSNSISAGNYDISSFLSLAGRHADNELFVTYQNISLGGANIWDVNYKMIKSIDTATSFKTNNIISSPLIGNNRDLFQTSYYTLDGRLLFTTKNKNINQLELYLNLKKNDIIIERSEFTDHTFKMVDSII